MNVTPFIRVEAMEISRSRGARSDPQMADEKRDKANWVRFSGIGFEFAAALAGFTLVGLWIDRSYGTTPRYTLIGAILGIIGGGYNFIRSALEATRSMNRQDKDSDHDNADD